MAIVFGDVAGQFKTLMALVEKCPAGEEIILVGDCIDRGSQSNRVLEWAIANKIRCTLGNHEHLCLDFYGRAFENQQRPVYDMGLWDDNGGWATQKSYGGKIPKEHLDWMASLPLYIETDDCFIAHSFWQPELTLETACNIKDWHIFVNGLFWSREEPKPRKDGKLQIAGHNAQFGLKKFFTPDTTEGAFAICLDDSWKKMLTAYDTKTGVIYQQEYIK